MSAPGSNDAAAGVAADGKTAWDIMKTCEQLAPRFTLGDVMLASPTYGGTSEDMRSSLVRIAHLAGAHVEVEAVTGEVIYVFPRRVRAAVLSRDAIENNRAFRRRAWRGFLVAFRFCFSVFLVVSVILVFLALVAIMIIALTQSRDRGGGGGQLPLFFGPGGPGGGGGGGGGPFYHHHGGFNNDFFLYLYMRDIWWLTYWNEHEFRMHTRRHGQHGRFFNRHGRDAAEDKPAGGGRVPPGGDSGGGGGGGGGGGDGDGGSGGYRPGAPPDRDPFGPDSDWNRFLAEEDEAERESGDKNRELTFIESIFAFVFGRGDPNEDLEHRRWRAVGLLLRVNKGAVYAEQLAPFLDSYLLRGHQTRKGLASALTGFLTSIKNLRRTRGEDSARGDSSRMHEGYVLEVLSRFGGHAESSDDGRLVYVFPALQVSTLEDYAEGGGGSERRRMLPPPVPPPIFERMRPVWEGGEKTPLVVGLGLANLAMVLMFKRVGGMDFRAPRRPLGIRARRTMGRKIAPGHRYEKIELKERLADQAETVRAAKAAADAATKSGADPVAAAKAAGGEIVYETVPATIRFLEMFPWICTKIYPLLFWYAFVFFAVPCIRAAYCTWENGHIKRRNDVRRERAGVALREIVAAREEKGGAAAGKKNLIKIVDEDREDSNNV